MSLVTGGFWGSGPSEPCLARPQRCAPQDTGFSSLFLKVLVQALQWLDGPSVEAGPLQTQLRLFAAQCSARRRISNGEAGLPGSAAASGGLFPGGPSGIGGVVQWFQGQGPGVAPRGGECVGELRGSLLGPWRESTQSHSPLQCGAGSCTWWRP